jgi:hypothetical protein
LPAGYIKTVYQPRKSAAYNRRYSSSLAASDSVPAPSSAEPSTLVLSGISCVSPVGGGGATGADFLDRFLVAFLAVPLLLPFFPDFWVLFAAFFVPLPAPPPFFVDFLAAFFVDFLAPPRDFDFDALFLVPLPPPLRAPLDFLAPFLAAMCSLLMCILSLAQRNKII